MLAARTRSGVVETRHDGAVALVSATGDLIYQYGDIEAEFFIRSSAKPFQAYIAQAEGADLSPLQLALACASHDGDAAHVAIVASMLAEAGLSSDDLQCPEAWPLGRAGRDRRVREGATSPRRIWHNCSGKHAGWLRASAAKGWSTKDYLDPAHPLQMRIREFVSELGGHATDPVGVDGCGAPVLRTTVRAMATMFSRLASDPELSEVFRAMHAYPAMVSGVGNGDTIIATALDAAAKRGALGCIGVSVRNQFGVAAKSWEGSEQVAVSAAAAAIAQVSMLSGFQSEVLQPAISPPSLGGGSVVGHLEPRFELEPASGQQPALFGGDSEAGAS